MIRPCGHCGVVFGADDERRKYCSVGCYSIVRKSRHGGAAAFRKGMVPWNKGVKGIHCSPGTEFSPGHRPHNHTPVGAETIRVDKSGKPRVWVKVGHGQQMRPRAQVVWESNYGAIPVGHVVHHKNRDTVDDGLDNLELITRAAHLSEHRAEIRHAKKIAAGSK